VVRVGGEKKKLHSPRKRSQVKREEKRLKELPHRELPVGVFEK